MVNTLEINDLNPTLMREKGMAVLNRELGAIGTICFLRQFSAGTGNYTAEREQLLEGVTSDDIMQGIAALRQRDAGVFPRVCYEN